jgi:trimeric autotransporter adhesin
MVDMLGWLRGRTTKRIAVPAAAGIALLGAGYPAAAGSANQAGGGARHSAPGRDSGPQAIGKLLTAAHLRSSGPSAAGPWRITTVAGGVGGPGPARHIAAGDCAAAFSHGYLYATGDGYLPFGTYYYEDPSVVRRISMRTGWLNTPVGSYSGVVTPDGLPATQAGIGESCGLAFDHAGNLIFTDEVPNLVRVVAARSGVFYGRPMTVGNVYTIGGDGADGYSGNGGPAVDAELSEPAGVAVDPAGNVIFDDSNNSVLRIIAAKSGAFYGLPMKAGDIYTVAGGGDLVPNGVPATSAYLELADNGEEYPGVQPWPDVTVDHWGNILLVQGGVEAPGSLVVIAGQTGTFYGRAMKEGYVYTIAGAGHKRGNGIPAGHAYLGMPSGVAVDPSGNILGADPAFNVHRLYVIAVKTGRFYGRPMKAGYIYILAGNGREGLRGDGGPAPRAEFSGPVGVTVDAAGNIVLTDGTGGGFDATYENARLRVVAEKTGTFYGLKMQAGDIYTVSGNGGRTYFGDGGPADRALLGAVDQNSTAPTDTGVAVSSSGNFVFADQVNNRIRLVPAKSGTFFGRRMRAGDIYTIAGDGHPGFRGDRGPGTRAMLRQPAGVALDRAGNVVLTDTRNNRVRVVAAASGVFYGQAMRAGRIYTIAGTGRPGSSGDRGPAVSATLRQPSGLAVDHHGNVVVTQHGVVRVIAERTGRYYGLAMTKGDIYTVATLSATGVAVDAAGNLVLGCGKTVKVVAVRKGLFYGQHMVPGGIYRIAGGGQPKALGDGIPARSAYLGSAGVAVDGYGNVLIADFPYGSGILEPRIRVVAAKSGTYYGVAMRAGDIYSIAGQGKAGLGNGGLALQARLNEPTGIAVAPSGAVLVLDVNRVWAIYP